MQEVGDLGYTAASVAPITGEAIAIKELPQDVNQIAELFKQGYSEMDFKAPHIMELNAELCKKLDKQRRLQEIESN